MRSPSAGDLQGVSVRSASFLGILLVVDALYRLIGPGAERA